MISKDGRYFISNNILMGIQKAKEEKKVNASSILLFMLTTISSKNDEEMKLFAPSDTMDKLEKRWEEFDCEPAMKREIIKVSISDRYETPEENILDSVSDISLAESPDYACFIVSEEEAGKIRKTNQRLGFTGFEIKTPEEILKKKGIYPFRKNFLSDVQKCISENC